ncbi:hypothetical protein MBLNU459_g2507t1 [Dothideomycetes sp. NU459]
MSAKYLVPALALAAGAVAQSSCSAATTTIQNAGDASALASCKTFTGSIAIATGTTDNIALDGISEIQGSLIANNVTQLTQISGSSLETITETFNLNGLTILSTLNFPRLTNVDSIQWEALPALQGLSFTTGVQTASTLNIQNTQLNSLAGIDLQVVDTVYIVNNDYLQDINMQLGNITEALTIGSNGNNVSAIFPNLIWANNMTIRNATSVSLPSLESVNGSLGFYSNEFSMLSAANLTTVGGSLSFVSNQDLTNVSMPMLKTVNGGLQVANNTEFKVVNGFPALATIGGALDFYGNFTNVTLPSITNIRGAFNLQSSADIDSTCSTFKALSGSNSVIKGKFTCAGEQSKPSGEGSSVTGTATGSSSTSTSTGKSGAAGLIVPGAATGLMGVVAVFFGLL